MPSIPTIEVRGSIRLGQFLKRAGLVEDGAEARDLIQSGDVSVNGARRRESLPLKFASSTSRRGQRPLVAPRFPSPRPRGLHECTSQ